ncbi:MAG: DUF2071 domain-containing protein [Candidatus Eremiobacterota bacterium]
MRPFLTARWSHLCLFNYALEPEVLQPYLPRGLELDLYQGRPCCSLVAFDFLETRVLGVRWPLHADFPELNLRFYVRAGSHRGVVFVKEIVPRPLVAAIARLTYNEPYTAAPLRSRVSRSRWEIRVRHRLRYGLRLHHLEVRARKEPWLPGPDSLEHHFKEHEWGFGRSFSGRTTCYRVHHPLWTVYPVERYRVDLDWGRVYGPSWASMRDREPDSVVLARGSEVEVYPGGLWKGAP